MRHLRIELPLSLHMPVRSNMVKKHHQKVFNCFRAGTSVQWPGDEGQGVRREAKLVK